MFRPRPRIFLLSFLCIITLSTCVSTTPTSTTSTNVQPINPLTSETEKALEAAQEAEGFAEQVLEAFLKKERGKFNSLASRPLADEDWYSEAFITAERGKETEASQLFRELWIEGPLESFEITDLNVSFLPYGPRAVGVVTAEVKELRDSCGAIFAAT